ncbi:hypothetical protein B6E66_07395 [Streptomyces maremycinicus]|nr:hypothetical protein B6E66_07395 [Streptomyces sp. B9173]
MSDTPQTEDTMVAALLRERAGYAGRKDMQERVEAVDEQLRLRGYGPDGERIQSTEPPAGGTPDGKTPEPPLTAPVTEPRSTPPKGRQARGTDKA